MVYCILTTHPFGPTESVPNSRIRTTAPCPDGAECVVESFRVESERAGDDIARRLDHSDRIADEATEFRIARAGAKKDPMIALGPCSSRMQQSDEAPPDIGVAAEVHVSPHVALPEFGPTSRLGPQTQHLMVVIRQHDATAAPRRSNHAAHDTFRLADVFENEARMNDIEAAPFGLGQGKIIRIALPPLYEVRLPIVDSLALGFRELLFAPFDADDAALRPGGAGQIASELAQPAADIEDRLPAAQRYLAKAGAVEQYVEGG